MGHQTTSLLSTTPAHAPVSHDDVAQSVDGDPPRRAKRHARARSIGIARDERRAPDCTHHARGDRHDTNSRGHRVSDIEHTSGSPDCEAHRVSETGGGTNSIDPLRVGANEPAACKCAHDARSAQYANPLVARVCDEHVCASIDDERLGTIKSAGKGRTVGRTCGTSACERDGLTRGIHFANAVIIWAQGRKGGARVRGAARGGVRTVRNSLAAHTRSSPPPHSLVSATYTFPALSVATANGSRNVAAAPLPSMKGVLVPDPARRYVDPSPNEMPLMRKFDVSATTSPVPLGSTATPFGKLYAAAVPRPSTKKKTPGEPPIVVVTHVVAGAADGEGVGVGVTATATGVGVAAQTITRTT